MRGVDALDDEAFVALFVHYGACLAQFPTVLPGRLNAEIENFLSFVRAMGDRLLEVVQTIDAFELHHLSVVRVEEGIQSLVQVPAQRLGLAHRAPIEPKVVEARRRWPGIRHVARPLRRPVPTPAERMTTMLDAHFGDVGDIGDIGDVDLGRATARPARSSAAPRDLGPEIRPWWVTHMQPLPPADSLRLRHRALYRLPRPCPDSDAAQYIADRLTENISDPGAPSHAQSRGAPGGATLGYATWRW